MHKINYIQTNIQHICNIGPWYSEKTKERRTTGRNPQGICYWGYLILGVISKPFLWHDFLKNWELEELIPIANLESKGLLKKGVLSPILVCNKDSVQEVCVVRLASSSSAYIGMILYVYWGGHTGLFFINSKTGNSYIIRKVNGSIISEIEFKRKNDHLFVRSKTNTASFRVSALFLDTTGVDLSLSMNIVDENLDDAEDIEIL